MLRVNGFAVGFENSHFGAVFEELEANTISLASDAIENSHIGDLDRRLFFHDTAGYAHLRVWFLVFF
jgi:hypothetical protein